MFSKISKAAERIGRRGAALIMFGLVEVGAGLSFAASPAKTQNTSLVLVDSIPAVAWGTLWVAVGLGTILASFWKSGKDGWGFQISYPLYLARGVDIALLTILGGYPLGVVRGLFGAFVYLSFMALLLIISGMDSYRSMNKLLEKQ